MKNRLIRDDDEVAATSAATVTTHTPPPAAVVAQTPRQPAERRRIRDTYVGLRQVTGRIDPDLFMRLKILSVQLDRTLIDMYEEALNRYAQKFAAENKYADETPAANARLVRHKSGQGCPVTAHVRPELHKWLRAVHIQTRKTMALILEEALMAYANSFAATRKFGVDA